MLRAAKLWCDTESAEEAEELSRSQAFPSKLGPAFTGTKLLWLKRKEPDVFARAKHLLLPASYINYWLSGEMRMDAGDASGTGFLNIISKKWDAQCALAVDSSVPSMLPRLSDPDEPISRTLTLNASKALLGLDGQAHLIVGGGSGDNACAALGCGVLHQNQLVLSLGISGTVFAFSEHPVIDPTGTVAPFCDSTGHWLPLICTLNCTSVLSEISNGLGQDHEILTQLAASIPPGCDGCSFLPYLIGERTPDWPSSSGVLLGIRPGFFSSPGLIYRAAMEGVTFGLLAGFRLMKIMHESGHGADGTICLVGGGARNPLWRQMIADVFQMTVRVPVETESAALGAALQGAAVFHQIPVHSFVGTMTPRNDEKVVKPRIELAAAYEEAFKRHCKLSSVLFDSQVKF